MTEGQILDIFKNFSSAAWLVVHEFLAKYVGTSVKVGTNKCSLKKIDTSVNVGTTYKYVSFRKSRYISKGMYKSRYIFENDGTRQR